jgi:hypothetical protein
MMRCKVHTPAQALAYLVDCTLATVQNMAMKKSRPKGEYARQISIAQIGVNWMKDFKIDPKGTRAEDIQDISVAEWLKKYEQS